MTTENKPKTLNQSAVKQAEVQRIIKIVSEDKQRRDQETTFFRNENLETYTEVAIGQFIGHNAKPEWKKDYQYNVFDPITRDKVMAILSKTGGMYEAQFFNTNKKLQSISDTIATVLNALYKDSTYRLNEKEKNKLTMLAALISPKAIWYEGWKNKKRIIRDIVERDPITAKITKTSEKKVVHYNGPYGFLLQVEDVIPGSLKERDLQEQPRMTILPKMQMETFRRQYPSAQYPDAALVQPFGRLFEDGLTEFTVRNDLKENEVEVITFFEKWEDRMSIIANGILITEVNSPMPFAHKDYPLVWGGFEELSPFFIYDMPLTMKLLDMQDVTNEVLNLTLDMVWRALNEVILVKDGDGINDDVIYGGGMVSVDNPSNFQKLDFGSSFGFQSASAVMERARRSIESSSLDAPSSGQSGSRQITAREAVIAREAALEITTLFLTNMENMEREKARLRVLNQLDRYKKPVEWEEVIGDDNTKKFIPVYKELSVRNARLDAGKRGTVNVVVTETPRSKEDLDQLNVLNDKELSQTIDISPELIRQIQFDVEIVANSVVKRTRGQDVAEAKGFLADATSLPNVLSVDYAAKEYVRALGKNPEEAMAAQEEPNPMEQALGITRTPSNPAKPIEEPTGSMEEMLNSLS